MTQDKSRNDELALLFPRYLSYLRFAHSCEIWEGLLSCIPFIDVRTGHVGGDVSGDRKISDPWAS